MALQRWRETHEQLHKKAVVFAMEMDQTPPLLHGCQNMVKEGWA